MRQADQQMEYQRYQIRTKRGEQVMVNLKRDKRLTKTSRWEHLPDGSLLLRIPFRLPRYRVAALLEQVADQVGEAPNVRPGRTDVELHERAVRINQKCFKGKIQWNAIRWVTNMQARIGSCTRGGPTDGQIRISEKIKDWPDWVIDYVIAHELMHRKHPNHSSTFWSDLRTAYPLTDQARGFIQGLSFAAGHPLDDSLFEATEADQNDLTNEE